MATYNNQHWLLSHIRNSFISTDDTGICETVMLSDDLPNHFLKKWLAKNQRAPVAKVEKENVSKLKDIDFICYPGLDQSDDEDMDLTSHSFDIQMYPEIGAHRYRSNTAQKLEKMNIARRKAARIKCVHVDDSTVVASPASQDAKVYLNSLFAKKTSEQKEINNNPKSLLAEQLVSSPKQMQNKFIQYARFDGTSQTGIATKTLYVFLNMLPEKDRNYPMKICVLAQAKIQEVIGFICYKCQIKYPDITMQSASHYGLYITEDNGEIEDFPPLDLSEPCSKFGFTHLTLDERRPSMQILEYRSMSMTSEAEAAGDAAFKDMQDLNRQMHVADDMELMLGHNDMIEAPLYRTYRVNIISKGFFKCEVQLAISGERIEIDPVQQKNSKLWVKQKAVSHNIDSIAYCEVVEERSQKAIVRLWYTNSQDHLIHQHDFGMNSTDPIGLVSTASPQRYQNRSNAHHSINFKNYDFETGPITALQIFNKINFILDVRSSTVRREFLSVLEKKKERSTKKFFKK